MLYDFFKLMAPNEASKTWVKQLDSKFDLLFSVCAVYIQHFIYLQELLPADFDLFCA